MIELSDIIELTTNTKAKRLSFATRYLVQENYIFDLTVLSNDFSGRAHFCVRRDQLEKLCADLSNKHLRLIGVTKLEDNDSDSFVEFNIEKNGHLTASGQVGGSHEKHFVKFNFQTDQTCISKFIQDFKNLICYND